MVVLVSRARSVPLNLKALEVNMKLIYLTDKARKMEAVLREEIQNLKDTNMPKNAMALQTYLDGATVLSLARFYDMTVK